MKNDNGKITLGLLKGIYTYYDYVNKLDKFTCLSCLVFLFFVKVI